MRQCLRPTIEGMWVDIVKNEWGLGMGRVKSVVNGVQVSQ